MPLIFHNGKLEMTFIGHMSPRVSIAAALLSITACASSQAPPSTPNAPAAMQSRPLVARAQPAIPHWANGAPGAQGTADVDRPIITPYLPPEGTANGTSVVIFPGGGYQHLSMEKEGSDVANWLAG